MFYQFPGIDNGTFIVQPVIQYGYNSTFGGNHWVGAPWHCDSGAGCLHGDTISVSPNDSIVGTADASACVSSVCSWTTTIVDVTSGGRSSLVVSDTDNYQVGTGGAMETHGSFTSCDDYPAKGTLFTGVAFHTPTGLVTPSWSTIVPSAPSPSCGFNVTTGTDSVHTIVNPPTIPPTISIDGPTRIQPGATCIWSASVSGGLSPYTYDWHMDGVDMGSDATLDAAKPTGLGSPFTVYLDVWGADGGHSSTSINVTESSTAPICPN